MLKVWMKKVPREEMGLLGLGLGFYSHCWFLQLVPTPFVNSSAYVLLTASRTYFQGFISTYSWLPC